MYDISQDFFSFVKRVSMLHGFASEIVALTEFVSLLTTQSVTVNLVQPGLILSKSHSFLEASLDSITTNTSNLETWEVEIKLELLDQMN